MVFFFFTFSAWEQLIGFQHVHHFHIVANFMGKLNIFSEILGSHPNSLQVLFQDLGKFTGFSNFWFK